MSAYRNRFLRLLPNFARSVPGTSLWAVASAIGDEFDRLAYFARCAYQNYRITACSADVLGYHGARRKIPRYTLDNDESYRARIAGAWELYRSLGTSKAIRMMFDWLGYEVEVICEKDWLQETTFEFTDEQGWYLSMGLAGLYGITGSLTPNVQFYFPALTIAGFPGVGAHYNTDVQNFDICTRFTLLNAEDSAAYSALVLEGDDTICSLAYNNRHSKIQLQRSDTLEYAEAIVADFPLDGTAWFRMVADEENFTGYVGFGETRPVEWGIVGTISRFATSRIGVRHWQDGERSPEIPVTVKFDDVSFIRDMKPDNKQMWNRFWVRMQGYPVDAWENLTDDWESVSDEWDADLDPRIWEFLSIVKRCRASYNLFVGFIFVQEDGSEVYVNFNQE